MSTLYIIVGLGVYCLAYGESEYIIFEQILNSCVILENCFSR